MRTVPRGANAQSHVDFVNALREFLRLAPLYDRGKVDGLTDVERFGRAHVYAWL